MKSKKQDNEDEDEYYSQAQDHSEGNEDAKTISKLNRRTVSSRIEKDDGKYNAKVLPTREVDKKAAAAATATVSKSQTDDHHDIESLRGEKIGRVASEEAGFDQKTRGDRRQREAKKLIASKSNNNNDDMDEIASEEAGFDQKTRGNRRQKEAEKVITSISNSNHDMDDIASEEAGFDQKTRGNRRQKEANKLITSKSNNNDDMDEIDGVTENDDDSDRSEEEEDDDDSEYSDESLRPGAVAVPGPQSGGNEGPRRYLSNFSIVYDEEKTKEEEEEEKNDNDDDDDGGPVSLLDAEIIDAELAPDRMNDHEIDLVELEREKEALRLQLETPEDILRDKSPNAEIVIEPRKICGLHWSVFLCVMIAIFIAFVVLVGLAFLIFVALELDHFDTQKRKLFNLLEPISGHDALNNVSSPQGKAYQWLLEVNIVSGVYNLPQLLESYALLVVAYATNETRWIPQKVNDPQNYETMCRDGPYSVFAQFQMLSWTYVDFWTLSEVPICIWNDNELGNEFDGVRCNEEEDKVIQFHLENYHLTGSIPSEIQLLSDLQILNLENNKLNGAFPQEVASLRNLTTLKLAGNRFTSIPVTELASLDTLRHLDISHNSITGLNLDPFFCPTGIGGNISTKNSLLPASTSESSSSSDGGRRILSFLAADCLNSGSATINSDNMTKDVAVICSCCTMCCNMTHCQYK